MTQHEKRIKIAEACGWKQVEQSDGDWINGPSPMYPWTNGKDWSDESGEDLPDYFRDLNACHEMEKVVADKLGYYMEIERLMDTVNSTIAISAPAEIRSEAFGRTLNLW